MKVLVVLGTRPEAIKLFPVIHALQADPRFTCCVCATGQHRELADDVLDFAGVIPDYRLDAMRAGQSLDALSARLMALIGPVIDEVSPDWVVVQGDTTSAFCGALAAYYRRIRVCHVEAGLRTGDIHQPWPEEANRKMIASFATLHCAPTQGAAENLRREGVAEDAIHVTGNTIVDALKWTRTRLEENPELASRAASLERKFAGRRIILATCHRRENWGAGMVYVADALRRLALPLGRLLYFRCTQTPLFMIIFPGSYRG